MIFADSGAVYVGGGIAAAFATVMGVFIQISTKRQDRKIAEGQADFERRHAENADRLAGTTLSIESLKDGLAWTQAHNTQLRADLSATERRVDELQIELSSSQHDHDECLRRIAALTAEIALLKGDGNVG